jgi:hypothetical protein
MNLFTAVVFSAIGMGYFVYGKRQTDGLALGVGCALMVFPYIVPGAIFQIIVGVALCAAPWIIRRLT